MPVIRTRSPTGQHRRFGFGFTADIMFADNYAIGTGVNVFRNGGRADHFDRVTGSRSIWPMTRPSSWCSANAS